MPNDLERLTQPKARYSIKGSDEYCRRRERNNVAVKKSRMKAKLQSAGTLRKVEDLKLENTKLEQKVKLLTKELSVLKDLFLQSGGVTVVVNNDYVEGENRNEAVVEGSGILMDGEVEMVHEADPVVVFSDHGYAVNDNTKPMIVFANEQTNH